MKNKKIVFIDEETRHKLKGFVVKNRLGTYDNAINVLLKGETI